MIDQIDERLKAWVQTVLGSVNVALTPPHDSGTDPVVHLYLMQLLPVLATPDAKRSPRQVMLHYLVTVHAAEPEQAHQLLGALILAALDSSEFDLDYNPLPLQTWLALGTEPQPAFVLKIPLYPEHPTPEIPLVRVPMVTRATSITSLQGVVLGLQDLPLQGVLVELPSLRQYQRTDSHGRFRFPTVPVDPPVKQLRLTGKGQEREVTVDPMTKAGELLVIHLFAETNL